MSRAAMSAAASPSFEARKERLEAYFDGTAAEAWARLTSDAPVSRIRATVREGREAMRATLLGWLPQTADGSLEGLTLLDAGCGPGALAIEAAERGAEVAAVDVAAGLIALAEKRTPPALADRIRYRVGDMTAPLAEPVQATIAMDSLIHYREPDLVAALTRLAEITERAILFTFAPRTPALSLMHLAGRAFPRADRAPAIEPVAEARLRRAIAAAPGLDDWRIGRARRVARGFYTSQAMELVRR